MIFKKKKWDSLRSVFDQLNNSANYAILRNWEELSTEDFLQGHEDVDIICDNPKKVIKALGAVKEPVWGHNCHYFIKCGNKLIEIGIRYVGDDYYDSCWEKEMLSTRVFDKRLGAYVLAEDMYLYSLLYHAFLHKRKLSDDYYTRLKEMLNLRGCIIDSRDDLLKQLLLFCRDRSIKIVFPKDYTVPFDLRNIGLSQVKNKFGKIYHMIFGEVKCDISGNDVEVDIAGYKSWKLRKIVNLPNRAIRVMARKIRKAVAWEKN